MIYLTIMAALAACTLLEKRVKNTNQIFYKIFMVLLGMMLVFRYGQGGDYFTYKAMFRAIHSFSDIWKTKKEVGFRAICWIFNGNFELFIAAVAAFNMYMLHRFISKFSSNRMMTLTLFYPTFYLTYFNSSIRQGIVISIFIGILFELLVQSDFKKYLLITLLATLIHYIAFAFLILPLVIKLPFKFLLSSIAAAFLIGFAAAMFIKIDIDFPIPYLNYLKTYYWQGTISLSAIAYRGVMLTFFLLIWNRNKMEKLSPSMETAIKIYLVGFSVYGILLGGPTMASRTASLFLVLEVMILPNLLLGRKKFDWLMTAILLGLSMFMTYKNIDSYIHQADYIETLKPYQYPYVSIFNKEKLWKYKTFENEEEVLKGYYF